MNILQTALEAIEILTTDNASEAAQAASADARIKIANAMAVGATTPLQQAAQAMIDRWESTDWKDTPHTAHYIEELRKALDAELAQSAEPVLYQRRMRPDLDGGRWMDWGDCSEAVFKQVQIVPSLHGWTQQARKLYLHPPQPQATTPKSDPLSDFDMRGVVASNLLCWKRLTEAEAQDLVCYFEKVRTAQGEKP